MNNEQIAADIKKLTDKQSKLTQKYEKKSDELRDRISELRRETTYKCPACNEESKVSDTDYFVKHWYESPHGCMGGDTWHESEDSALIVCPRCTATLQISKDLMALKNSFKSRSDQFGR